MEVDEKKVDLNAFMLGSGKSIDRFLGQPRDILTKTCSDLVDRF
jgi:hypothetical protein